MLEDYKDTQPIAYKILKNTIKKDEFSHAYLFETNSNINSTNLIKAFIKSILCPNHYTNMDKCSNCTQCDVIDSGNYPEIEIINPDGMWIKKQQLQNLQKNFNETSLIGNKRIYIINEAEKLGLSSANSILKFLEEPVDGVIAILIVKNMYNILETIRSRCQIIRIKNMHNNNEKEETLDKLKKIIFYNIEISDEVVNNEIEEKINKSINFVNYYEKNHKTTLLYINKLLTDFIKTKEEYINAFNIMILYYKDIINLKLNQKSSIFIKTEDINNIIENNTTRQLCKKINILLKAKENIKYNANINLLIDKLIIDLEGGI